MSYRFVTSERYIGKSVRMTIEGKTSNGAITRVIDLAGKRLRERERQGGNERVLEKLAGVTALVV